MEDPTPLAPALDVTMLLADAAQVADGKLYLLGGGLSVLSPRPQPVAVALLISVPWDRANIAHQWRLDLIDEDGRPVTAGDRPVAVGGRFEAGRPAGLRPGNPAQRAVGAQLPQPAGRGGAQLCLAAHHRRHHPPDLAHRVPRPPRLTRAPVVSDT